MRKHLIFILVSYLGLSSILSCNNETIEQPLEIRSFRFGHIIDNSDMSDRFNDDRFGDKMFSAFSSVAEIEAAEKYNDGSFEVIGSRFDYASEASFLVKPMPQNAIVKSVTVTSSNPEILEVIGSSGKDVRVRIHDVGETTLAVTVHGALNSMSAEYPIRIVSPVHVEFFISSFWKGATNTRIRMRASSLPMGMKSVTSSVMDSVSVIGYCEYYDFRKYGRKMQYRRDTIRFGLEEEVSVIKKDKKKLIRNITSAIKEFRKERTVKGSRIRIVDGVVKDTTDYDYHYIVESVILDFNIFGGNPYYEYYFTTKCDRTVDVVVDNGNVDGEEGEEGEENHEVIIEDGGTDEEEDFDPSLDGADLTREESACFIIRFNNFYSQSEQDRLCRELQQAMNDLDYDDSRLTDEEKEKRLKDLEDKMKDDEKK